MTKIFIFGVRGDLGNKKLLPSLNKLISNNDINDVKIFGISRQQVTKEEICKSIPIENNKLLDHLEVLELSSDYSLIKENINEGDNVFFYLSVVPSAVEQIVLNLVKYNLNQNSIIVLEKPFGTDLNSAKTFFNNINKYFTSSQIYLVDHYLCKESVKQFINFCIESKDCENWFDKKIKTVRIFGLEKIDIQGRSSFYEETGAFRDFLQNHLMTWLALFLSDYSSTKSYNILRTEAIKKLYIEDLQKNILTSQYVGYTQEVNNPNSKTETYISIKLNSNDENWKNTSFVLTTAKACEIQKSTIEIEYYDGYIYIYDINKKIKYDAYDLVFLNLINKKQDYFVTVDEVIASWSLFDNMLNSWKDKKHITYYEKYTIK